MKGRILSAFIVYTLIMTAFGSHNVVLAAPSGVCINEVCALNTKSLADSEGKNYDWIELYNSSDSNINLSGYSLSDNHNYWPFPNVNIAAKGYLLVWAANLDYPTGNGLYTNFAISQDGENVHLAGPGGLFDTFYVPGAREDITYGRIPDGSDTLDYLNPTPLSANTRLTDAVEVDKPTFTVESGFYDDPFDLTISALEGQTIYYTLDGSDPTIQSTKFTNPLLIKNCTENTNILSMLGDSISNNPKYKFNPTIKVDKSMIVRAIACDAEGNHSKIATQSYFVGYNIPSDFNNVPVISLVSDSKNLFDFEKGIYVTGKTRADWVNQGNDPNSTNPLDPANYNMEGRDWERPAHLSLFENNGILAFSQNIGIRIKGNSSRAYGQKSFTIYSRDEYGRGSTDYPFFPDNLSSYNHDTIYRYDGFVLSNGGEKAYDFKFFEGFIQHRVTDRAFGTLASRLCVVFIDGEYWGPYVMQERLSPKHIKAHYGVPDDNVMLTNNNKIEQGTADTFSKYFNPAANFSIDHDMTNQVNYYKYFHDLVDYNSLIDYFAAQIYIGNNDWLEKSFAAWRSMRTTTDTYQDGKWRFIMSDADAALENTDQAKIGQQLDSNWIKGALLNPTFKRDFVSTVMDIGNVNYGSEAIEEFKQKDEQLRPLMYDFYDRFNGVSSNPAIDYYIEQYNSYLDLLTNRMSLVTGAIKNKLALTGNAVDVTLNVNDPKMGSIKLNTTYPNLSSGTWTGKYFTDYPIKVTAIPTYGYKFVGWEASDGSIISDAHASTTEVTLANSGSTVKAVFEAYLSGDGSASNPYKIYSETDLKAMSNNISSNYAGYGNKYFELANNIEITNTNENNFTPIGGELYPFKGNFNGKGFTISGIKTSLETKGQGLFGYVGSTGIVKNVGIINSSFTGSGTDGKNVGGVVGNNAGLIENCYTTGTLSGVSTVGGIVGNNSGGIVRNCYSNAQVNSDSTETLGGIAGKTELSGSVTNCYSLIAPVGKNDGGTVTGAIQKDQNAFKNGEVAYRLNECGTKTVWAKGASAPIFANTTNKPIIYEVKFVVDGMQDRFAYTYSGGTVELPSDSKTEWKVGNTIFTAQTPVTSNLTVTGTVHEDFVLTLTGRNISLLSKINVSSAKLIAASYLDNQLIDLRLYTVNQAENETKIYTIDESFNSDENATVKVMLLSNLDNMAPMIVSKSLTILPTPTPSPPPPEGANLTLQNLMYNND